MTRQVAEFPFSDGKMMEEIQIREMEGIKGKGERGKGERKKETKGEGKERKEKQIGIVNGGV